MKIEIKLQDHTKLSAQKNDEVIRRFLQISSEELTTTVKKETPVDYGKLRGSWIPKLQSKRLTLTNSRNYAVFVEKGTGIFGPRHHRIFPVSAKVLHFNAGGQEVFTTNVQGRPASHMAEKGLEKFRYKIPKIFNTAVHQTLK